MAAKKATKRRNGKMMVTLTIVQNVDEDFVQEVMRELKVSRTKAIESIVHEIQQDFDDMISWRNFKIENGELRTYHIDDKTWFENETNVKLLEMCK